MTLYVDEFLATLPVMGKGMGGIFIVTVAIILCIVLLNAVTAGLGKRKADKQEPPAR